MNGDPKFGRTLPPSAASSSQCFAALCTYAVRRERKKDTFMKLPKVAGVKVLQVLWNSIQYPPPHHSSKKTLVQGISYWSVKSNSALMGRRVNHFIEWWFIVGSGGLEIWVSSTTGQKSNIGWPQFPKPPESTRHHNSIKSFNLFYLLRTDLLCILQ